MSNLPTVNVVTNAEREKALLTIVAAFAADPVVRWIVPQADIYLNHGVRFFDIFGGAAFAAGAAYEAAGFAGAALWVPPNKEDGSADEAFRQILKEIAKPERVDEVSSVLDEITARRMQDVGYVELPFKQYFHYPDTHTGTSQFSVSTQSLDRIWMVYRDGTTYAAQGGLVRVAGYKESGAFTSTAGKNPCLPHHTTY